MGLFFDKLKEPVFLKESGSAEIQLEKLKALEPLLNPEGQKIIQQDITCLEYGIAGEKNIAFELKNSHMPMYVLHDICLESDDLSAQIDYMVFTRKLCFVIECKNLYGNIEIDNAGNFVRTMYFGTRKVREGLYSPITQNRRHLELMKKIKVEGKSNIITKMFADRLFDNYYRSVVVLANPKTVLYDRYAKKEIRNQVIRADQLNAYIKKENHASKEDASSDDSMFSWAMSYMNIRKDPGKDYLDRYEKYRGNTGTDIAVSFSAPESEICPQCGGKLVRRNGKYGEFFGCSNYPKCRYTEKIPNGSTDLPYGAEKKQGGL